MALIDAEDYERVREKGAFLNWSKSVPADRVAKPTLEELGVVPVVGNSTDYPMLKNFVLGLPKGTRGVTHKNDDLFDCRKANLDASRAVRPMARNAEAGR